MGAGAAPNERTLGTRTLRGIFWAYGSFFGSRVLMLVSTAILARLLSPRDFGLVALALLFMILLETLSDLGISQALVISKEGEELERAETAFVWTVTFGAILTLLTAALSPLAAAFFHQHRLVWLLPVLGLRFLLRSLGATHYALAQKWMDFRSRTAAELSDGMTRGLTGIVLALAGLGVWSLVIGYLVGAVALSSVLWLMVPWRPRLKPKRVHLPKMLRFGGTLTLVDILAAFYSNTDYLFIGRVLGATQLGLYTIGFRLPDLLIGNLSAVAGRVLFPAFAAVGRSELGRAFRFSLRYTLMIALPSAAVLCVLAHPLILALFGGKWEKSVPVMQLITLYALGSAMGIPAGTVYKASGRAGILLAIGTPRICLLIATVAIFVDHGIVAVAACVGGVTMLFALIGLAVAVRMLKITLAQLWRAAWAPLFATAGMTLVLVAAERSIASPWPALITGGLLGGATYFALMWLFARDALERLWEMARPVSPPELSTDPSSSLPPGP